MSTRIYAVKDKTLLDTHPPRLIISATGAGAIRHCASKFEATVPDTKEVANWVAAGVVVEVAKT